MRLGFFFYILNPRVSCENRCRNSVCRALSRNLETRDNNDIGIPNRDQELGIKIKPLGTEFLYLYSEMRYNGQLDKQTLNNSRKGVTRAVAI